MTTADLRERRFDPVVHGQRLFRQVLEATARPGSLVSLEDLPLEAPEPRLRGACALLLALLDLEVTFHAMGPGAPRLADYVMANTGTRLTPLEAADFVLIAGRDSAGRVALAKRGSLVAPHGGATLLYAPDWLSMLPRPDGVTLCLRGPGIPDARHLAIGGITPAEIECWKRLNDFPLGVDIWLAASDGQLAAIPRSIRWDQEA